MRAIFISYRRDDTEGQAGRLFDDLTQHFGGEAVFMDVAAIEPGRDFRRAIDEQVASCGVLLAIIGKSWLTTNDESGARRLDDQMDFVRLETASALKRDIPVVPVLVHGARMPRAEDLPEDLKELAFRNAVELTHARWDSDVQVLVKALRPYVQVKQEPTTPSPPSAPSEPGPTRKGSSRMIIAASVSVLVLVFGAYVWHQKSSEETARKVAAPEKAKVAAAAEEDAPTPASCYRLELIPQGTISISSVKSGNVSKWFDFLFVNNCKVKLMVRAEFKPVGGGIVIAKPESWPSYAIPAGEQITKELIPPNLEVLTEKPQVIQILVSIYRRDTQELIGEDTGKIRLVR